jgi:hypothetical protein
MLENLNATLKLLGQQDIHKLLTGGMPEPLVEEIKARCSEYQIASPEGRSQAKAAVLTERAGTAVILIFVTRMATLAMQLKDKEALDIGLVALDLSSVMKVDYRDAMGPASVLAFAAKECGVDIVERAKVMIPDISPQLTLFLAEPGQPKLARDGEGRLIFWNPWSKSPQTVVEHDSVIDPRSLPR